MIEGAARHIGLDLAGLRVAITGGASGIGRVIADGFAANGASVFISDIDEVALTEAPHAGMLADAGDHHALDGFMTAGIAALGGLDVLVNNVGIAGPTAPIEEVSAEALDATLRVCLASQFHCARRAVPALKAAGGGLILNLSSAAGKFGFPLRSPYAAAKWGVIGLTRTLAIELGPAGIRVNALLPGLVEGPRIRGVIRAKAKAAGIGENAQTARSLSTVSLGCFVTPHDIANMALYLASPFGRTISGQAISIDGGTEGLA